MQRLPAKVKDEKKIAHEGIQGYEIKMKNIW